MRLLGVNKFWWLSFKALRQFGQLWPANSSLQSSFYSNNHKAESAIPNVQISVLKCICTHICARCIHSKSWIRWIQKSADDFEFSAERLSENAKCIKIILFAVISFIYVQSLQKISIKTLKHTIFSTKMPHWHQILVIFMIYALLSGYFVVAIYALFPQNFGDWKGGIRRLRRF